MDNQVKLHGFRIELAEIESVLRDVPGIDQAIVKLIKDVNSKDVNSKDVNNEFLAAYMVPDAKTGDVEPNELVIKEALRKKLPLYMVPSSYRFLEAFPRLPNSKIDHKALPSPIGSAANLAELVNADVYELPENQPATDTERSLRDIWEKTLEREKLSVNSNFFDMGGNSISAMRIMSACKSQGIALTILDIFDLATIRLCSEAADQTLHVEEGAATDEKPASDAVEEASQPTTQHSQDDMAV